MKRIDVSPSAAGIRAPAAAPAPVPVATVDDPWTPGPVTIGLGLLALSALAGGLLMRRRREGGAATVVAVDPDAPSTADALDVELHEMIAEARARRLLSEPADSEPGAERQPTPLR